MVVLADLYFILVLKLWTMNTTNFSVLITTNTARFQPSSALVHQSDKKSSLLDLSYLFRITVEAAESR
jgi:hypothetical protein